MNDQGVPLVGVRRHGLAEFDCRIVHLEIPCFNLMVVVEAGLNCPHIHHCKLAHVPSGEA